MCARLPASVTTAVSLCSQRLSVKPISLLPCPPGAFNPPPKVDSAVAVFRPLHPDARYGDLASLEKITTAAFGQRRKMMRASLRSLAKTVKLDTVHWLESCNIDPTARAETLSQSDFRALADKFGEATHAGDAG